MSSGFTAVAAGRVSCRGMSCCCGSCAAECREVEVEVEEWIVDCVLLQPDSEEGGSVY
jgi:hypothetical protein